MGSFGVGCTIGVTGLEFFLCGDKRSVVDLGLGALAEALFFTVDFFFLKKRFEQWANLPSSVSGLEVRQVGV